MMHIGCCENCRYLDLMENVNDDRGCPRCGGHMVSLGLGTVAWNRMSMSEREKTIRKCFAEAEAARGDGRPLVFQELFPKEAKRKEIVQPEAEQTEAEDATEMMKAYRKYPEPDWTEQLTIPEPEDIVAEPRKVATEPKMIAPEPKKVVAEQKKVVTEPKKPVTEPEDNTVYDKVYVCYKCSGIAAHNGSKERYRCADCGSVMVEIGYTTKEWTELSKEEKRQVCEEAKIRHMLFAIKNASYDEDESESVETPSIINVVDNKDHVYV